MTNDGASRRSTEREYCALHCPQCGCADVACDGRTHICRNCGYDGRGKTAVVPCQVCGVDVLRPSDGQTYVLCERCDVGHQPSFSAELVEAGAAGIHDGRVAELKRLYGVDSPYYQMYSSMGWEQCDETTKEAYRNEARWVLEAVARVEGITS